MKPWTQSWRVRTKPSSTARDLPAQVPVRREPLQQLGADDDPVWASDSKRLAYVHERQVGFLDHSEIRMISVGGRKLGSLHSSSQDHDEYPQWSPDGRQVVFDRDAAGEPIGESVRLY